MEMYAEQCLVSIFSCHGWIIHTIEGIGDPTTKYNPIQRLLADNNGTQCGFCSPGMVMNMFALHASGPKTKKQIEDSFSGNLCRCTGYRPILTAFKKLASDAEEQISFENGDIEDLKICQKDNCIQACNETCDNKKTNYHFVLTGSKWMKVYHLKDLLEILNTSDNTSYMLVAGNTARGVYHQKTFPTLYVDITSVNELTTFSLKSNSLIVGGNFTLARTIQLFFEISKQNDKFAYLGNVADHINLVANVPVRNIGTIAGNLMIKHEHNEFPSDIFLLLETYNAIVVIVDTEENEIMVSPQDFLKVDMNNKVIKHIVLNGLDSSYKYLSYKIMARAQNTHALVNSGFLLKFSGETVVSARIVYGAINPEFVHATKTENFLKGKQLFDNNVLQGAFKTLDDEIHPDYVLPDSRPEFRKLLAVSLFYKFVLYIAPEKDVASRIKSGGTLLERPVSSGIQEFGTNTKNYPLGEPIVKVEALAQTSGQAQYIDDVPDLPNQLFAAFVTANAEANSQIISIDTTPALSMKGVVAFYGKDDIPGQNTFTPKLGDFLIQEELFCSGRVQYYDQPIGIIVASDYDLAIKAAELVKVTYTPPKVKPYLNMKDVLTANDKTRIHHQTTVVPKSKGTDVKHVVKGDFFIGLQYHFHMEVQCCNVVPTEDSLDLYPSTQWMDTAQIACSAALNIPMNRINVNVRRLGGGFGAKIMRNALVSTAAALAAYKLKKPVKIWMSLETNMRVIGKRYPLYTTYEVGVNDKGVIQYLDADLYSDFGVGGNEPMNSLILDLFKNCYDISTWSFSTYIVNTDTAANCYARAPGTVEGLCAIESIMEHIAYSINVDASDVKMANIDKTKYPKLVKFWDEMQMWGDVAQRKADVQAFNAANRWKKKGISLVPMAWTLEVNANYSVLVSIFHGDGTVVVSHGGIEIGQGINTKVIQVCAYKFGINTSQVTVRPSYNVIAPNSSSTGGSITSESVCYALLQACDVLLARMKPIRDKMSNPSWSDLINKCFLSNIQLTASGFYSGDEPDIQEYLIFGVCATEVEVDLLTGQHQILRVDILEDVGDSMSPLIDIGQVEGAFVMGIGYYTTEEIIANDEGKVLTDRTWNYRPPGAKDIPINFRIKFPENNPNPIGVLRSKAIAEPPICLSCSLPLAIRNALASARQEAAPNQPKWFPFIMVGRMAFDGFIHLIPQSTTREDMRQRIEQSFRRITLAMLTNARRNFAEIIELCLAQNVNASAVTPETTLNSYLRDELHLTGTKKLCMEGGCGSCLVVVEETVGDTKRVFAVNSCLVSVFSIQGWTIHTIESIGNPIDGYHPIQELLANNNGSQCGFCSPGMVMNMYALSESGSITEQEIEDAFAGNICRCTGYRPILQAFRTLASERCGDIEDLKPCKKGDCLNECKEKCENQKVSFQLKTADFTWIKVYTISELLSNLASLQTQTYMLVSGNTARGVYRTTTPPSVYIDVSTVTELTSYSVTSTTLTIGGNCSLKKVIDIFNEVSVSYTNFAYLTTLVKHISLVANVPVRNIGTIAGNLMIKYNHKDFPSDIFLLLETFNAVVVIVDSQGSEVRLSPLQFLSTDMNKRVIKQVVLSSLSSSYKYVTYKIMGRSQNTHALVNAGFLLELNFETVVSARIVYGCINPDFVHATSLETFITGKILFDNNILKQAFQALNDEIQPDNVLPNPSPEFRKSLAISLFYKFVLSIAPENLVSSRNKSGGSLLERPLSTATQEYGTNPENYPVGEPVIKVEALAQCSGQAEFIIDIPDRPHQLYGALVTAKAMANSQIVTVDASKALALTGVVAYYGKDDIPGENTFTPAMAGFFLQEELFCSGRVQYYDQTIGIIVAETQGLAIQASHLVEVTYSAPSTKPYLNVKEVIDANVTSRIRTVTTVIAEKRGTDVTQIITGKFYVGMQYHFHMEAQCCNVVPTEDGLDLYPSSQWMDLSQLACAAALNIPTNRINVKVRRLGGAFGAKILRNSLVSTACALAAHKLNRPVKLWLPMETNMTTIGKRFPLYATYEVGVNAQGLIQYMETDLYTDVGVGGNAFVDQALVDMFENCYDISTWTFTTHTVSTDIHANCYTRAPGSLEGTAAIEHIMEHIAYTVNLDTDYVKAVNVNTTRYPKVTELWSELHIWAEVSRRRLDVQTYNSANRWKKRGMSLVPMKWTLDLPMNYTVLVSIFRGDGGVVISHGGIEMGQGINTKAIQACAQKFGISMDQVSVKPSYNVIAPNSMASGGSITSEGVCFGVLRACEILIERMAPIKESLGGNPAWVDLVNQCYFENVQLTASGYFAPNQPGYPKYIIYGACVSEVEVDILTGQQQILRYDVIEDVGESISPLIDIGQVEGAVAMGIGYYTTEQIIMDEEGKILTNRTWNYTPPGAKDIPINLRIKFPENNPNPDGVLRSKAIAEPPICVTCSIPLAIRNAMASARAEADSSQPKFYPFDGPSTVENTLLNSCNSYEQFTL